MPTEEALIQAGRDVLRYHVRRVYSRPVMSASDAWTLMGSLLVVLVGIAFFQIAPDIGLLLVCLYPVIFIVLVIKSAITLGYPPDRKEAANAAMKYNQAIHLLTHSTDVAAVGPLIEALWLPGITAYVPQALGRLLLQLESRHATLLNAKQRKSLTQVLTQPDSSDLSLQRATVKALGKIGDASALTILEQLADGGLVATDLPELQEDARTALFELQERINPGFTGRNLLRASDAPTIAQGELLRPVSAGSETPPQELLRAQNAP